MASAFQVFIAEWIFLVLGICLIGLVALVLGAVWMYRDAQMRRMDAMVWIVLLVVATVLGTLVGFAIVFILYLVLRESHPIGGAAPYGFAPYAAPVIPTPCPVCGRPMMWYIQYGRWYCPSCAQYR